MSNCFVTAGFLGLESSTVRPRGCRRPPGRRGTQAPSIKVYSLARRSLGGGCVPVHGLCCGQEWISETSAPPSRAFNTTSAWLVSAERAWIII
jgi:hypothetical protein